MAYYVNGKIFTDHPLMDEICYGCKTILNSIVIKNDILAIENETENSVGNAEMYFLFQKTNYIDFNTFYFTYDILKAFGYKDLFIDKYLKNKSLIPEKDRKALTDFANSYFKENFEEENDYYRMLMGLPPFKSGSEYYIWLSDEDIPAGYKKFIDFSIPLHEQPKDLLNILNTNGVIDKFRKIYVGSKYSYIMYLGDKSIDLLTARKAAKWDILYIPNVYYLIKDNFIDLYNKNREIYINRSYQEFFAQSGEYYDQMMILIVLAQTFSDMITDVPEWYIRKDIFDLRSCKYFLESSGVEYFKIIPLKYQIRIVKNLNKLIKYKSSNQNIQDILDIFDVPNTKIYKYWLYKKKDKKSKGYSLEFISSDYKESYDAYVKDTKYRTNYDDITLQDKYWDSNEEHELVKNRILNQDFTIQGTKYMSVEYQIPFDEWLYQTEYMIGLILDSKLYDGLSDITFGVPTINDSANFRLSDLFLFLVVINNSYYRNDFNSDETKARIPEIYDGPKPTINEENYDWKKKYFPEIFVVKNGRINGFNTNLDKDSLIKDLTKRHSHYRFGSPDQIGKNALTDEEYKERAVKWIEELGIYDYIVPENITNIDELIYVYNTNTEIYNNIKKAIIDANDENDRKYLEYIYQELFTVKFDINFYNSVDKNGMFVRYNDLIEVLKDRNYILYETFLSILYESNIDTKQDIIRGIMNDIISILNYYISSDGLEYIYSFVSVESFGFIVNYLHLMLNFFKSYKVYFLDPYYTIISNDKLENSARAIDVISEFNMINYKFDKAQIDDNISNITNTRYINDNGEYDRMHEMADIYSYYDPDPLLDMDFNGGDTETEKQDMYVLDGGFSDDIRKPYITVNCGNPYLGSLETNDMNGGDPYESSREYYSIDGGEAYDPDYMKTDAMGSQRFNYMIDGGCTDGRNFINNSMNIKLIGTELQADAIISKKNENTIVLKEDGLYISLDNYGSIVEFNNMVYSMNLVLDKVKTEGNRMLEVLYIINNPDYRYYKIKNILDPITYNIEYTNSMMNDNAFIKLNMKFVDDSIKILQNQFKDKLNPYAWEELN